MALQEVTVRPPITIPDTETQKLEKLGKHVDRAVRALKMGQSARISCNKFTMDEVRNYLWGYAVHKKKWFTAQEDSVSNALIATRTEKPVVEKDEFEEEEAE